MGQLRFTMPNISEHQLLLNSLGRAWKELWLYLYVSMLQKALSNTDVNSDDDSPPWSIHLSDSSSSSTNESNNSHSSKSLDHSSDLESTTGQSSGEFGSRESMDLTQILMVDYYGMLVALEDEVAKVYIGPPSTSPFHTYSSATTSWWMATQSFRVISAPAESLSRSIY